MQYEATSNKMTATISTHANWKCLQITRQQVSTFLLNKRWNQILLQVAAILLLVLLHL
jgi:hypothetical protein